MSKFTRVSETIPDSMVNALGFETRTPELDNDPYAQLKASSDARRSAITREIIRSGERKKKVASTEPSRIEWEKVNRLEEYEAPQNVNAQDISGKAIRRMSGATDQGENIRDMQFEAFQNSAPTPYITSQEEAEDYLRQASIWNPDVLLLQAEVSDICNEMMHENNEINEMQTRRDRIAESRKTKHSNWENEQTSKIQHSRVLSNSGRANMLLGQHSPLICTSTEKVTASKFGIPDWQIALERDQQRAEIAQRKMTERKAIKRQGFDPEEDQWDNINIQANTYQGHKSDWLDSHLNSMVQ